MHAALLNKPDAAIEVPEVGIVAQQQQDVAQAVIEDVVAVGLEQIMEMEEEAIRQEQQLGAALLGEPDAATGVPEVSTVAPNAEQPETEPKPVQTLTEP